MRDLTPDAQDSDPRRIHCCGRLGNCFEINPAPPTIVFLGAGDRQTFGYAEFRIQNPGTRAILIQQGRPEVFEQGVWKAGKVEVNWPEATPRCLSVVYQRERIGAAWPQRLAEVFRFRSRAVWNTRLWHPVEVVRSSPHLDPAPGMASSMDRPINTSLWDNNLGRIRFVPSSTPGQNRQSPLGNPPP